MSFVTLLLIAGSLALDALAVSITSGVSYQKCHHRIALKVALFFGFFQAVMPVFGYFLGIYFFKYVQYFAHWIAFFLLLFIGGKMIYESIIIKSIENKCDPRNTKILLGLAIATSIDAFAIGVSFSLLQIQILKPVIVIGIVTFVLSYFGFFLGSKIGSIFESKMELWGGIVLILIGCKILLEHYF